MSSPIVYSHPRQISRPLPSSVTPVFVAVDGNPPLPTGKEFNKPQRRTCIRDLFGHGVHDVVAALDIVPKHREKASEVGEVLHVSDKLVFILEDLHEEITNSSAFLASGQAVDPATLVVDGLLCLDVRSPNGRFFEGRGEVKFRDVPETFFNVSQSRW